MKEGAYLEMSDIEYHKQFNKDEHYYSSSQLKTMLEDPQKFHQKYILGKSSATPQAMQDAFDVGTVVHTAILEPDKLKASYVLWEEGNRTGKLWKEFSEKNEAKLILNKTMKGQATNAIKAVKKSKFHEEIYCNGGQSETSFFVEFHGLRLKVRADWIKGSVIHDLKTTTGNVRDLDKIKKKIKTLNYDLSAALYVDVINHCIDKFDLKIPQIETFMWDFVSKDKDGSLQIYDAKPYLPMGRAKYLKAIELIKHHEANDWSFPEEIITLEPYGYEVADWIKPETIEITDEEQDIDLL